MIQTHTHEDVFEVVINNPPVNALGAVVRQGIAKAIADAQADDSIKAIVIRGSAKHFSGGADITEFGKPWVDPSLPALVDVMEACTKPIIAAIRGVCLGGGLEIALACHYRIAAPSAMLGLPEVKLGLLPGAGGTQRLPRLIGVEPALEMVVLGDPIGAERALELKLIDKTAAEETLAEDAIAFARSCSVARRTGELAVSAEVAVFENFAEANARKIKNLDAPKACIEAVRTATMTALAEGQEKERALFGTLMHGDQSKALRHIFFAERAAAKVKNLPKDTPFRPVNKVGVIGAGTMGGGISMNFLSAGIAVTIVETNQEALERGVGLMRKNYEATAAKGRISQEQVESAMGLLTPTLEFEALADCDLIVEAVYENMDVKKEIFTRLDGVAKKGAIIASNTSYLDVDEIASVTSRPEDILGLHFFSPANIMKLVEVVRGAKTAPDALATSMALARKIKKTPVVTGVCHGFIGNRMLDPRQDQSLALLLEGATPSQIDKVHTDFGMPMGPFQMADLAGVDIGWHRDETRVESIPEALCAQGRWGQKTKCGYYDYDEKRRPSPSPVTEKIIADFREQAGITPREISEEEIVVRTLYTMVNEAAKILEENIAQQASDIDVVWVYGYGWPRHRGGPMFWADTVGLVKVVQSLEEYRDRLGEGFSMSELLQRKSRQEGSFIEA